MAANSITYPPGPPNARQVLLETQKSPVKFLYNLQRQFGNFAHYRHGPAHVYLVNDPDLIRRILVDLNDKMDRPEVARNSYGKFLGHGLLVSAGELHRTQRRAIQPLFTSAWIAHHDQNMVNCANELMDTWQDGEIRDIAQDMTGLTMNIVYRT
jgi:cytochrome P450